MTSYSNEEARFIQSLTRQTIERKIIWERGDDEAFHAVVKGKILILMVSKNAFVGNRLDIFDGEVLAGTISNNIYLNDLAQCASRSAGGLLEFMKSVIEDDADFSVDLLHRRVTHKSGASATFHEYQNEEDWLQSDAAMLHNPSLYDGSGFEFARLAKNAAVKAGMKYRKPQS